MTDPYPVSLAIFDFVPTVAFFVGALFLVKTSMLCRGKPCGRMVMAGTLLVFLGGFFKATWKLFLALGLADQKWMSELQFVLAGIGFSGICVAVVLMVRSRQGMAGVFPFMMAPWKIPFLFVMTVTSLGAEGILAYISFKRKVNLAAVGFVVGVLGILAMGSLASAEQTTSMQWIEETVNAVGQLGFMFGSIFLFQDFKVRGCDTHIQGDS